MNRNAFSLFFCFTLFALFTGLSPIQAEPGPAPSDSPTIAIFVFSAGDGDEKSDRFLTDVLRTEIFKTRIFRIVERGVIQQVQERTQIKLTADSDASLLNLGKALNSDKMLICNLARYSGTQAVNVRVVDVKTSLIEYTENLFLQDDKQLLGGLKDLVIKLSLFYSSSKPDATPLSREARDLVLLQSWQYLNAGDELAAWLVEKQVQPDDFLELRQYDVNFNVTQFVKMKKTGLDTGIIRAFLQDGIPFNMVEKALDLGITKLTKYKAEFARRGVTFEQYLMAYEKNITTWEGYQEWQKGFRKDYFLAGVGGVADQFPLANADFKFAIGQMAWEHFWTSYNRDWAKYSTEAGFYFMSNSTERFPAPVPYAQFNAYFGQKPYYLKFGVGSHAEILLGGHFACALKAGLEIDEWMEMMFIVVPFGTQPRVSYADLSTKVTPQYGGIVFPYLGALFTLKL